MTDDKFKRQLVPPTHRSAFSRAVTRWLAKALPLCSETNVFMKDGNWVALDNSMPVFEYRCAGYSPRIAIVPPTELLQSHKTHQQARLRILRSALALMQEATIEDEEEMQRWVRAEELAADGVC